MRNNPAPTGPVIADRLAACIEAEADIADSYIHPKLAQSARNKITAMRIAAQHVRALAEAAEKAGLRMEINWWR